MIDEQTLLRRLKNTELPAELRNLVSARIRRDTKERWRN
jgi:hypothetical protein